eukprot:XP_001697618.1 predicted protein [Chlamydomonas reinhardtii]
MALWGVCAEFCVDTPGASAGGPAHTELPAHHPPGQREPVDVRRAGDALFLPEGWWHQARVCRAAGGPGTAACGGAAAAGGEGAGLAAGAAPPRGDWIGARHMLTPGLPMTAVGCELGCWAEGCDGERAWAKPIGHDAAECEGVGCRFARA